MATHSSILVWGIPWTEEPAGPQSILSQSQTQVSAYMLRAVFGLGAVGTLYYRFLFSGVGCVCVCVCVCVCKEVVQRQNEC